MYSIRWTIILTCNAGNKSLNMALTEICLPAMLLVGDIEIFSCDIVCREASHIFVNLDKKLGLVLERLRVRRQVVQDGCKWWRTPRYIQISSKWFLIIKSEDSKFQKYQKYFHLMSPSQDICYQIMGSTWFNGFHWIRAVRLYFNFSEGHHQRRCTVLLWCACMVYLKSNINLVLHLDCSPPARTSLGGCALGTVLTRAFGV